MRQKDQIGGGRSDEEEYTTWELKECPACGRLVVEYYAAIVAKDDDALIIKETIILKKYECE